MTDYEKCGTRKRIKATTVVWDYVTMGNVSLTYLSVAIMKDMKDYELSSILMALTTPWRIREFLRRPQGGDIRYMTATREFRRRNLPLDSIAVPGIIDEKW